MITDKETDYLYLADSLAMSNTDFYTRFVTILNECNINYSTLLNTKDIWAVDYMPIQIERNRFIQFVYSPDYLQSNKWLKTISDVDKICRTIGINPVKSSIVVDGGNVVRSTNKVIMCDKVFLENPGLTKKQLVKELEKLFQVDKIIFIPQQPKDYTGHADGMIRFLDDNTVIINTYLNEEPHFMRAFYIAVNNANLDYVEIPYCPHEKPSQANGYYINYLQMKNTIIIPTFDIKEDEKVVRQFEQLFNGQKIATVNSNEIANEGGILNCISWNIQSLFSNVQ